MSRRTKWFQRFGRKVSKPRRTFVPRAGRALAFEQCEPRIALSTNDSGGGLAYAINAVGEGGLISFDSSPISQFDDYLSTPVGRGETGSLVVIRGEWLINVQAQAADGHDRDTLNYGGAFHDESKVRLIDSPLAGLNHPEGGQIAITERPGAGWAELAASPTELASLRASRPPVVSQELTTGVETSATREVDGLRGRAMMLEVAHATPSAIRRTDNGTPAESWRTAAVGELHGVRLSAEFASADQIAASSHAYAEVHASSQPSSHRGGIDASEHYSVPVVASSTGAIQAAAASVLSAMETHETSGESQRAIALAARDAALDQWRPDDVAPMSDAESSAAPLLVRSRRVLAVALVLSASAGSFGKLFRRRKPENAWELRPSRSRAADVV